MLRVGTVRSFESGSTCETADEAIRLWTNRPNVVNRRLCGSSEIWTPDIGDFGNDVIDALVQNQVENFPQLPLDDINSWKAILRLIAGENEPSLSEHGSRGGNCHRKSDAGDIISVSSEGDQYLLPSARNKGQGKVVFKHVVFRKLLPRSLVKFKTTIEIVATTLDSASKTTWFIPICTVDGDEVATSPLTSFTYGIKYTQKTEQIGRIELLVMNSFHSGIIPSGTLCANLHWLKDTLLPKLKAWAETIKLEDINVAQEKIHSLALVDVEEYATVYNEMKSKYAEPLIKSWQENTDPKKFVFEDIAIASYLMVLWKKERRDLNCQKKQTFVDLGCGNGLLVYLLTSEGHHGFGIDIRKRKIWDSYGKNAKLLELPLHPDSCRFDKVDWIIGNHSDELTPWIPVITARSSYNTKYFLLPCCFHDFAGKFTKNCPGSSQYQTYLEYIAKIGEECGFVVEQDIQRIPSTKRNCHIARKRTYSEAEHGMIDSRIQRFLKSKNCRLTLDDKYTKCQSQNVDTVIDRSSNDDLSQFRPREAKDKVRNCTQIDNDVKSSIVMKIFTKLLMSENKLGGEGDCLTSKGYSVETWNTGGKLSIQEAISLIDKEQLNELKSQCGGLQTLLKNHGHIFEVVKGEVLLRNYKTQRGSGDKKRKQGLQTKRRSNFKTKLCWYHFNHPQGCLLQGKDCRFAHSQDELACLKGSTV